VLWHCWLGGRKGIRPVKNRVVGCWRGYLYGAMCRLAYGPVDAIATHCLLLQQNPDWFCLSGTGIRVVPGNGPLNGCVCMFYWLFVWLCFFQWHFIDLFSCIAASLFNKLTYWRHGGIGVGCGAVPVRDESAGVECQSAELPREVLHTTDSRHRPGRTHSRQEVSMCRLVTARCYASAVLAVALGPSVSVRLS